MNDTMQNAVEKIMDYMKSNYKEWHLGRHREDTAKADKVRDAMISKYNAELTYTVGNKYIKVLRDGSTAFFIVNVENDKKFSYGDVLMAASWNAPARNFPRANVFTSTDEWNRVSWIGAS